MGCLRASIPKLNRSSLHGCLLKHGISRLPVGKNKTTGREKYVPNAIDHVHIDIAKLRLVQGKLNIFGA